MTKRLSPALLAVSFLSPALAAQTLGPSFAPHYIVTDLGTPAGVLGSLGGVSIAVGDANTLLISGGGAIHVIDVQRDTSNHITGFVGSATQLSTAPLVNGGLAYGPDDVLFFTTYPTDILGQIKPGSSAPDKSIALGPLGVVGSTGALAFVPEGFAGAGSLKIMTLGGSWYDARVVPDGSGTFEIKNVTSRPAPFGSLVGAAYVAAGSPAFTADSVLISEYSTGKVGAYEVDGDGDPILSTRRDFVLGLLGSAGAFIDPLTGDLLFSHFAVGRVLRVSGFDRPEPLTYCSAKVNSCGSLPSIGSSGIASATAGSGFTVSATNTKATKVGLLLYTNDGRASLPFSGGSLCVDPSPLKRSTVVVDSTGTPGQCDGTLSIDMNAFAVGALGGNPLPGLTDAGTRVNCQFWARDTIGNGALLSDGLEYFVGV